MKFFLIIFTFIVFSPLGFSSYAEEDKIAAIVNGEEISSYTLEHRVDLAIRSSNLPDSAEVRGKVRQQVLEILIDEKLKNQEAARLKIEASDSDLQDAITDIEKQNHLEPGGFDTFLAKNNFPEDSVKDQIKSQVLWKKIVVEKIRPKISVGENEVQDQIQIMANQAGKKQYDLSEIVLQIDDKKKEDEVKTLAEKLVTELNSTSGNFVNTAKQFSSGETAKDGGEMGLISPDKLDKKILKSVEKLKIGGVSEPIRTEKGYEILRLNKIKTLVIGDPSESEVVLKQVSVSLDPKSSTEKTAAAEQKMREIIGEMNNCQAYEKLAAAKSPGASFRDYGRLEIKNLAPEIRGVVASLKIGEPSGVLRNASGLSIFLVCDRKDKEGAEVAIEPDASQVNEMLLGQKIELAARKYMVKLRNEAFIEKRI